MRTTIITAIIILLINFPIRGKDFDLLVTTYSHKNALINVELSKFEDNAFTATLKISWVNSALKPVKDKNSVLAIDKRMLKISPENSLNTMGNVKVSSFSNKEIQIKFYVNPSFNGGKVKVSLELLYAENEEKAKSGQWEKLLYSQPKSLEIEYFVDAKKIKDVFPPEIKIVSPLAKNQTEGELPVISDKKAQIYITAQDKSGVKSVKINDREAESKFTGEYYTTITLFTGQNTVKIDTEDNMGNKSTTKFDIICTYQYDIKMEGGRYYALLIAENDYNDDEIPDLRNPLKDAEELKKLLISNYTFKESEVLLLKNPKREEIITAFERLTDDLSENDNLLIFYAGHGYWDAYKEIGYWLPSDAQYDSNSNWLRNSTVKDYIGAIKTKHTLLITDACFSGSIFQTRGFKGQHVVAYQKIYNMLSRKGMTSGTLKEVPDVSVFLKTLIKRLNQNEDKYLPVSKLFTSMRDAILNNSPNVPQFGTIQGVGDEGGEFIFIKKTNEE